MTMNKKLISMLDDLETISDELTPWEVDFVDSVGRQVEDGRKLSDKQMETLRKLHERKFLGW